MVAAAVAPRRRLHVKPAAAYTKDVRRTNHIFRVRTQSMKLRVPERSAPGRIVAGGTSVRCKLRSRVRIPVGNGYHSTVARCRLCERDQKLRESHILPKFVWDWLKESSVSAIRTSTNPNVRVQDGFKAYLLCEECEQRLSRFEKPFAEHFFRPVHDGESPLGLSYGAWALPFAVSVAWRILIWDGEQGSPLEHLTDRQRVSAMRAERTWRAYLLGQAKHPSEFEQHVVIFDIIESHTTSDLSPFFNRYITRTIDMALLASQRSALTFAKLCKIFLFGHLHGPTTEWKGTRLRLKGGALIEKYLRIPTGIFEYINEKADRAKRALDNLSPNQAAKAQEVIWKSPDRVVNSLAFEALMRDVELSGKDAFRPPRGSGA